MHELEGQQPGLKAEMWAYICKALTWILKWSKFDIWALNFKLETFLKSGIII